ncbi:MAG TPA: hypothetical protein VKP65_20540 [Rhodothermales bacterium]|nr:hypothetical protein [Rhodothermales bacterium]
MSGSLKSLDALNAIHYEFCRQSYQQIFDIGSNTQSRRGTCPDANF